MGRPSIPPERLLRAMLLQAFYSIRSERQLMERLEYDLLFRWFVGLGMDDAVWDHSMFSKNRDRLLEGEIAGEFLAAVLAQPRVKRLLSSEHFSVDGTLIEAWASMKSFRPKDGTPPPRRWRCRYGRRRAQRRRRLPGREALERRRMPRRPIPTPALPQGARHGGEAVLHRPRADGEPHGPDGRCLADTAGGHAERVAALDMIEPRADRPRAITLGADKGYDAGDFVDELRSMNVTPACGAEHQRPAARRSTGARRGIAGYAVSQRIRKRIEEAFGWIKTVAGHEQDQVPRPVIGSDWAFTFAAAAYNLVRLPKLLAEAPP